MPNRNIFDDREKYDHSSHRTGGREKGDLAPAPNSRSPDPTRSPITPRRR
jgi:hypothetical protein